MRRKIVEGAVVGGLREAEVDEASAVEERDRVDSILLWRGVCTWGLVTMFVMMLALLVVFLHLISSSPLTPEDLEQCREDEYDPDSAVVQLTQLNYFNLTNRRDSSWLIEL
jgi:hypothetical protein